MEPLYYIWIEEDSDCDNVSAVVSNEYYPEFDMWVYLN